MLPRLVADAILVFHLAFILFVFFGGLLVLRYRWVALLHLPCAFWGSFVELSGRLCPLTTFEVAFRRAAGDAGYNDSFVEHYVFPLIYPDGLTRDLQYWIGGTVIIVNVAIYAWVLIRSLRRADKT